MREKSKLLVLRKDRAQVTRTGRVFKGKDLKLQGFYTILLLIFISNLIGYEQTDTRFLTTFNIKNFKQFM